MKKSVPYVLGLDIGVSNNGHAAIDENFNIVKFRHKKEIGVLEFKKANTAEKRRMFRDARRRFNHRKWRLKQFDTYMAPYFEKMGIDYNAYIKNFKKTWISPKDKVRKKSSFQSEIQKYGFPTRYHAMNSLINDSDDLPRDSKSRLKIIFEVFHSLIKYRGNFLENGLVKDFKIAKVDYSKSLKIINQELKKVGSKSSLKHAYIINDQNERKITAVMNDTTVATSEKVDQLTFLLKPKVDKKTLKINKISKDELNLNKRLRKAIASLILGKKINVKSLNELFNSEETIEINNKPIKSLQFGKDDTQEILDKLNEIYLIEPIDLLNELYRLYRQIAYAKIVPAGMTYSESMVKSYKKFGNQLNDYKKVMKDLPGIRDNLQKNLDSYLYFKRNGKSIDYTTFISNLYKEGRNKSTGLLAEYKNKNDTVDKIIKEIISGNFLIKQRSLENNNLPRQLFQLEMRRIIKSQSKHPGFDWLARHDLIGYDEEFNLERFIDFRIPYYVGPLAKSASDFSWLCFKNKEKSKLTVWNFYDKVDLPKTINNFIRRMTATDTYLLGEPVLPASSLIYQKYEVLNELNKIKIDDKRISVALKENIYEGLFKKKDIKIINLSRLCCYLNKNINRFNNKLTQDRVSGLGGISKFNSSLSTYHQLKKYIPNLIDKPEYQNDLEKVIEILTIFDPKSVSIKTEEINKLSISKCASFKVQQIASLHFKDWGRLSKKLLLGIKTKEFLKDNDKHSILDLLWLTNNNFQQIVKSQSIQDQIQKFNIRMTHNQPKQQKINNILKYSRISPENVRSIRQNLAIVNDYVKFNRRDPEMISLEFARGGETKNNNSKYERVKNILENTVTDIKWKDNLENKLKFYKSKKDDFGLKEYLYFTQDGKDIYDCSPLDFNDLDKYDIDHIYARSKNGKDNSINNKVLTSVKNNRELKKDKPAIQVFPEQKDFWKKLKQNKLISDKKYKNLITDWTKDGASIKTGMLARSLVETATIIKITAQILTVLYPRTRIIAINAGLSTELRRQFHLYKVREVNDYHHAIDAYLAAFGAAFLWKLYPALHPILDYNDFQKLDYKKINNIDINFNQFGYSTLNPKHKHRLVRNGKIINANGELVGKQQDIINKLIKLRNPKWISIVHKPMEKTKKGGGLFKQTINKAKKTRVAIPLKRNLDPTLYGYYASPNLKYMILVKSKKGYSIINVPIGLNIKNKATVNQLVRSNLKLKPKNDYRILIKRLLPYTMAENLISVKGKEYKAHFLIVSADGPTNADQLWLSESAMSFLEKISKSRNILFKEPNSNSKLNTIFLEILENVKIYLPMIAYEHKPWKSLISKKEDFLRLGEDKITKEKLSEKYNYIISILKSFHGQYFNGNKFDISSLKFKGRLGYLRSYTLTNDTQLIFSSPTGLHKKYIRLGDL